MSDQMKLLPGVCERRMLADGTHLSGSGAVAADRGAGDATGGAQPARAWAGATDRGVRAMASTAQAILAAADAEVPACRIALRSAERRARPRARSRPVSAPDRNAGGDAQTDATPLNFLGARASVPAAARRARRWEAARLRASSVAPSRPEARAPLEPL
jgi:hypothetical protein